MENEDCLPVECFHDKIKAQFRFDLFDEGKDYLQQMKTGGRTLKAVTGKVQNLGLRIGRSKVFHVV